MAQQSKNTETKRGPGRPPGSKNKPKNGTSGSSGPTTKEVIEEMQRRSDRDKRNIDIIWSITLFAAGLFLFFTVVMDTTGSFGMRVHDLCNGLFGIMAYILPFLVFAFAGLLFAGKLQHIGARTVIFSALIFINMCILNSYRFIDINNLRYGFGDIADYYRSGVNGEQGGAVGMEFGSILAKLFGMPGLLIIAFAVLIISVFLVANTPISRFIEKLAKKSEQKRFMRELEEETQSAVRLPAAEKNEPAVSEPADIPRPFGTRIRGIISSGEENRNSSDNRLASAERGAVSGDTADRMPSAAEKKTGRNTFFGRIKDIIGIDSETGQQVSKDTLARDEVSSATGPTGYAAGTMEDHSAKKKPGFEYPESAGSRIIKPDTGFGLGDPDEVRHPGAFGLDAHSSGSSRASGTGMSPAASKPRKVSAGSGLSENENIPERKKGSASKAVSSSEKVRREEAVAAEAMSGNDSIDDQKIAAGFNSQTDDSGYVFPPVSLLKKDSGSKQVMSSVQLEEKANLLEQTLNDFGVDATVINVTQGASVTRYEVQPATGVKVSKITGLADDIALNLRAKSIRIEAPIPGKAAVGIEVENDKPAPVLIRDLIESEEFRSAPSKIEFVVGKDISGNNIVADLRDMPHMLIAGATGSGKSVCINSIITSFLYKARPSELKLIMVDPKVVELGNYNGIPHMLTPVVTDPRKASRALAIAVEEMDKRYELFAENNVKDLESFNELMRANQRYADCKPQIVIIIDELADLMMAAPSEVESSICRLAQKARAAGMHLIVATQRPSVDVVTGLIKANIPSRIAFSVASQFDSRTILDMAGAEKLLGKGDMLFSPVGSTKPYRVQGPFISEKETDSIIKFVKNEGGSPEYDEDLKSAIENADKKASSEPQDELTEDAIAFIFKSKQASVSMLQRRFRIGYNRAARIIDEIEERGIIGPSDGSRPRQLLLTEAEYYGTDDDAGQNGETEADPAAEAEEKSSGPETSRSDGEAVASQNTDKSKNKLLSNTRAMDSFNSLPESAKRAVMDSDNGADY